MKYRLDQVISEALPGGMAYYLVEVDDGYDLIQLRRGQSADLASVTLEPGEPAYCFDTDEIYIGGDDGENHPIKTSEALRALGDKNGNDITTYYQTALVVGTNLDSVPTENSNNPITSGGVYAVIGDINSILEGML